MILNSMDKQLVLAQNGTITWQKDLTNPMLGEVVAEIKKGESMLSPTCSVINAPAIAGEDKDAVQKFINQWLGRYIQETLQPLFNLKSDDIPAGAPRDISDKIYNALGVIPRAELQSLISQMDEEKRNSLRSKKIRFGPLLVYLPELNKPVMVKLRALLLSLWEDKDLPAEVPTDGIVSFSVEGKDLDKNYYQSIGYPIFGPRSIRVDMLDRVICAVYDTAKDGKFMAQHQMAEWLGSNIADLYAVLEAMGHTKISDPADEVKVEEPTITPAATLEGGEAKTEQVKKEKPELATFSLKKGKAIAGTANTTKYRGNDNADKNSKAKKFENLNLKSDKKKFKPSSKNKEAKKPQRERVFVAEAKSNPEDSPFAILQQLKTNQKD